MEISTQGSKVILCTLCDETNEESQVHLLVCEAPAGTSIISSDKNFPVYEDIYVEDATKVESIGQIIMEKYDLLKKLQQNLQNPVSGPDAHSSVNSIIYNIVNTVIRAATGTNTSGAGS